MAISDLVFIDSAGYHFADYPSFQNYLTGAYQNIFGEDTYLGSDSQDGQWLGIVSQALYDTASYGGSIFNSFSPSTAQGVGLSRNVQLNGIRRMGSTNSTVELTIGGTAFTTITNGQAIDELGQIWLLPSSVTIPMAGTITVTATSQAPGAIQALPDTVNGINTPTQGWQTVNNAAVATIGTNAETDAALRNRQAVSTSIPAQTVFDATIGAVSNVPGVIKLAPYENYTNFTDSNGLPPHSISLVVEGGDDTAIAQTILDYKTPGTDTYGTTSVPLTDQKGMPITINFFRPSDVPIAVQVTLTPLSAWVSGNESIIAAAIAAYINALPIGGTVVLTQLYAVAYVPGTTAAGSFNIESIETGVTATGTITFTGTASPSDTIDVNGTTVTFVASSPTGNQVLIGGTADETATNLQEFLAASMDVNIAKAFYSVSGAVVTVSYIHPGPAGDAFTLSKSSTEITLSGATLTGGALGSSDIVLAFNQQATCQTSDVTFIT